jgi:Lar family restriction alleviation protein
MNGLKPCPFCGGKVRLIKQNPAYVTYWTIFCNDSSCPVKPQLPDYEYTSEESAIEAWNTRKGEENP